MKKLILLAIIAVSAMSANAQERFPAHMMLKEKKQMFNLPKQSAEVKLKKESTQQAPSKLMKDDCYYLRPKGSFVVSYSKDSYYLYACNCVVPPYTSFKWRNAIGLNREKSVWSWGKQVSPEYYDDDYNLEDMTQAGTMFYLPTLSKGNLKYTWGSSDYTWGDEYYEDPSYGSIPYTYPLSASDSRIGRDMIGWGYLSTHYLYGDGSYKDDYGTYKCFAVEQPFVKPMSPLYVEDIYIQMVRWDDAKFLADGEEMTMYIIDSKGNITHTLTCTADDISILDSGEEKYEDEPVRDIYYATAVFSEKEIDPLSGSMATVPFVIDYDFSVAVTDFEDKGIGFIGHKMSAEEAKQIYTGDLVMYNVDNPDDVQYWGFDDDICMPFTFTAFFDKAMVLDVESYDLEDGSHVEYTDLNVLKASADGQTVENVGDPELANFVVVNTASSWFDEEENEMYYLSDAVDEYPEWVYFGVDNTGWEATTEEDFYPIDFVGFACDPLPAGVAGRGAKLYVNGRGIVSETPIYILQGDYTKEQCDADEQAAGVNSVLAPKTFNGKTYSISGQQVNKNFKGIVIKDGKKFLNK